MKSIFKQDKLLYTLIFQILILALLQKRTDCATLCTGCISLAKLRQHRYRENSALKV